MKRGLGSMILSFVIMGLIIWGAVSILPKLLGITELNIYQIAVLFILATAFASFVPIILQQ